LWLTILRNRLVNLGLTQFKFQKNTFITGLQEVRDGKINDHICKEQLTKKCNKFLELKIIIIKKNNIIKATSTKLNYENCQEEKISR